MALKAKPSPLSPPQPQLVSPPPPARRAGRCGQTASPPPPPPPPPVEPSATLTLSPQRRGPPWTWRPGPRPPPACSAHRAPAPSDPPSPPPAAAGASGRGDPEQRARAGQGARDRRWSSTRWDRRSNPRPSAGPRGCLLPRLLRAGPACLTPPPGRTARTNHRRGPLHHFRTRAHVIRGCPAP